MNTQTPQVLTGATIVVSAQPGILFKSLETPVIVIKKEENGILIYDDSKEIVIVDNDFLSTQFTEYVEQQPSKPNREYIPLDKAMRLYAADQEHIHANVYLPSGEVKEDICLNQFLPIVEAANKIASESPIEVLHFMSSFMRDLNDNNEGALLLIDPVKASIPVEILVYGRFFVGEKEAQSPFSR